MLSSRSYASAYRRRRINEADIFHLNYGFIVYSANLQGESNYVDSDGGRSGLRSRMKELQNVAKDDIPVVDGRGVYKDWNCADS